MSRHQVLIVLLVLAGAATAGAGLFVGSSAVWRLLLLAGLALLWLGLRGLVAPPKRTGTGSLMRLALIVSLCFAGVALQLARNQITRANDIRVQAAALFQPNTPAAATDTGIRPADRTELGSGRARAAQANATGQRGSILDRAGQPLAQTQAGQRVYPNAEIGHITGFSSRLYGQTGLEAAFDSYLSGAQTLDAQALLRARLVGTVVETKPADLVLTLDSQLQAATQAALGERKGAVVLIEPSSGAILALATWPRFNPNQLVLPPQASEADLATVQAAWQALTASPDSPLLNRATQGRYPPGSVIKTLTAAAVLDAGVSSGPEGPISCPNRLDTEAGAPQVRNAVENLARRTGDPSDLRRVFAFSCNTAFAQLGMQLGVERFAEYAARFGLGYAESASGEADLRDIPADAGSIASNATFLARPAALADTAYGQGQALVTPLDMAQMVAVIANNGALMRPFIVREAKSGDTAIYTAQPEKLRDVISPDAAAKLRAVMQTSVEIGYANPVALPGVTIGAKTGTAETASGVPHSWFVALAPVEQPRFAIAVIVEGGGEGSRSALPVARQVLAAALGVQP